MYIRKNTYILLFILFILNFFAGDSCCNPLSMGSIKSLFEKEVKGVYVKSLEIGSSIVEVGDRCLFLFLIYHFLR